MTPNLDSFLLLLEVCIVYQSLFSSLYLSIQNWKQNKWMVMVLLAPACVFLSLRLGSNGFEVMDIPSITDNISFLLLIFPGLYFYVRQLVGLKKVEGKHMALHFLPFLFFSGLFCYFEVPMSTSFKFLFTLTVLILSVIYCYFTLQLVKLNQEKYKQEFAEDGVFVTLNWVKWMMWMVTFIGALGCLYQFSQVFSGDFLEGYPPRLIILSNSIILSFFSFMQPTLYKVMEGRISKKSSDLVADTLQVSFSSEAASVNNVEENSVSTSVSKYDQLISEEEKKGLIAQIEAYMIAHKPFLQPKIRMPELANLLQLSPNVFSYLINEYYGMNFFKFINQHRVQYAAELLKQEDYQHYTLEAIAEMAGFNSKTTFNNRFKEMMSETPSMYRRRMIEG